jgi:protein-S-isoprenylcysteine O-methyltransferase Ste14
MDERSETSPKENHPNMVAGVLKRVLALTISFAVIAVILFLAAGTLTWVWAWVYLGIGIVSVMINGAITLRTHPATIAERGEARLTRKWDSVVSGLYTLAMYIALPLVAGLDVRFGWTGDLSLPWHVAGAVLVAAGLELGAWAMIANAYFSIAVRIQSERGHTVCTTGPYRFVRHPGYVGFILQALALPILLGSLWALIPGLLAAVLMGTRTFYEDRSLQAELPGYPEYVQKVRYRLIPGIW